MHWIQISKTDIYSGQMSGKQRVNDKNMSIKKFSCKKKLNDNFWVKLPPLRHSRVEVWFECEKRVISAGVNGRCVHNRHVVIGEKITTCF